MLRPAEYIVLGISILLACLIIFDAYVDYKVYERETNIEVF